MIESTDSESFSRALVYIPIIHSPVEMGAFSEWIRKLTLQRLGAKAWKRKVNLIDTIWQEIERVIESLPLSYKKVRLYQDGLPVCDREVEIVADLAKAGSQNHRLLLRLMERGARIMGTESSELLVEEYALAKQILTERAGTEKAAGMKARQKTLSDNLIKRRDRFIANRINSTLQPSETGVIFLGMLHSLKEWLPKDIVLTHPINWDLNHREKRDDRKQRQNPDRRR